MHLRRLFEVRTGEALESMILGVSDHPSFELSLERFLDFASKLTVDVVELKLDRFELLPALSEPAELPSVKNLLGSYDFKYVVHAPSIDVNLASLNSHVRNASEKTILKAANFANDVGAGMLVSHVGRLSRDYPRKLVEKSMKNAVNSLKSLVRISSELGVIFTVENDHKSSDQSLSAYPEQVKLIIENVGCKLTFDVGHANTLGKINEFLKLDRLIGNVHLHDNNGVKDEHKTIGEGNIDFLNMFRKMKKLRNATPLIVECHSLAGLKQGVEFVRQRSLV
jgi:sugar phosphate isomerase/epimerase